jgi:hypothetical protein
VDGAAVGAGPVGVLGEVAPQLLPLLPPLSPSLHHRGVHSPQPAAEEGAARRSQTRTPTRSHARLRGSAWGRECEAGGDRGESRGEVGIEVDRGESRGTYLRDAARVCGRSRHSGEGRPPVGGGVGEEAVASERREWRRRGTATSRGTVAALLQVGCGRDGEEGEKFN